MADYKSMYYHLAGRTATAVDVLEATIKIMEANVKASIAALDDLKEKLKMAQQATEDLFINDPDEDSEEEK